MFPFVFDVDFAGTLVVEEDLTQDQFEIVLVHVHARGRYFIISHVREVKGGAVTMTGLCGGVDVPATLEETDVLLGSQNGCDIETVVG